MALAALAVLFLFQLCRLSLSLNQEGLYLLQARRGLEDPNNALSDWNPRDSTPCNWTGITCSSAGATVTSVDLTGLGLTGPFPASFCRLPNLAFLSLSLNNINSSLPDSAVAPCAALAHLDLSQNLLVGPLPDALAALPSLAHVDLTGNNFSGPIPPSFGRFPVIQDLSLVANLLTSTVPAFLGNLTTLRQLNLSYNPFAAGGIPPSLGNLSSLEVLWLAGCNLIGDIPPSLGRLSKLADLDLSTNALSGRIPESIANLSSVVQIELYNNSLSGPVPLGFGKLSSLLCVDASMNQLEGPLPEDLFDAPFLESVHFYSNRITGSVPSGVSRSTSLIELRLFANRLNGSLPVDLGKNSPLMLFDLSDNLLSGEIPESICDRGVLEELLLIDNLFSGRLPEGLGRCRTLARVRLSNNQLSGEVPAGFWGLPHLWLLELRGNSFSGGISPVISSAANLSKILIDDNQFSGSIPSEMGALSKLYEFSASNNRLSGPLPSSLGNLGELGQLDLHHNFLSGELLRGIQSWKKLSELNLADNEFTGRIPPELGDLPVLNYLDLSGNLLTGDIPLQLQNLKLNEFNLSNNDLSGPLPPLFARGNYRDSFLGNPGLCHEFSGSCPVSRGTTDRRGFIWLLRSIFMLATLIFVVGVAWFFWRYRKYKKAQLTPDKSKWTLTSFHKLGFSEYEILDCLDEDNVIGSGGSGKVYKAVLSHGETVAVKKLWGTSKKEKGVDLLIDPKLDVRRHREEISKALSIGLLCTSSLPINRPSMRRVVKMLQEVRAENKTQIEFKDGKLSPYYGEEVDPNSSVGYGSVFFVFFHQRSAELCGRAYIATLISCVEVRKYFYQPAFTLSPPKAPSFSNGDFRFWAEKPFSSCLLAHTIEMMNQEASLEATPTWAVAGVCSILIFLAVIIEDALHRLTLLLERRKRKTLNPALNHVEAELRNLGLMSLLLTVAEQPISKICIPASLGDSFLPCKDAAPPGRFVEEQSCQEKGRVSLVSSVGTQQLQILIIVLVTLVLGEAKMKRWKAWEEETSTLEYQLSNDPRRFKLTRETSFGERHLRIWSNNCLFLWIVCFFRQFTDSVSKADYFSLRRGFVAVHFSQDCKFDFRKFLQRSLDKDFAVVVSISFWIWMCAVFFIFFNAYGFYSHYWLPFVPLVILLVIGTKLEVIITTMCLKSSNQAIVVPGTISVELENSNFWFAQPRLLLHLVQFILIQNSFQLAFFTWAWYNFGVRSCFYREVADIILSFGTGVLVQFLCAYVTLPLYALVTQMGSSMKETIFTDEVMKGLKSWKKRAKKNLANQRSVASNAFLPPPYTWLTDEASSSCSRTPRKREFRYPSRRLELLEVQRVVEEVIRHGANNMPNDGEVSFGLWRRPMN
ncbi:Leucine rich repeat N-terminal domain [Musa troglodytarum]|uniref:non-specific serine/threonine protein kinase n=1 Tax=Musa troglodytarum TaxID=320322 RepID=A0A9E7I5A9_9LILI|nr:Leucine rich repeat N-terminal domain [Musa troglodytarum]